MDNLIYELHRQDVREAIDRAGRYAWYVYDCIVEAVGDHELAGKTAKQIYEFKLELEVQNEDT